MGARPRLARGADPPRPGSRGGADGRLARAGRRGHRGGRTLAPAPGPGGQRRRRDRARRPDRRLAGARPRGGQRTRQRRWLGGRGRARRAARLPRLAGPVRQPRRLPTGSSAVRGAPPFHAPRNSRRAGAERPRGHGRHLAVQALPLRARPAGQPRHAHRHDHRRPGGGPPQPRRSRPARAPGKRLPRARRADHAAFGRQRPRRWCDRPPRRHRPPASRCAWRMWCLRWPSACPPTRCCSRRRRPAVRS